MTARGRPNVSTIPLLTHVKRFFIDLCHLSADSIQVNLDRRGAHLVCLEAVRDVDETIMQVI